MSPVHVRYSPFSPLLKPSLQLCSGFLVPSHLRLLGENEAFDRLLLEPIAIRGQNRLFKKPNSKTGAREEAAIQDLVRTRVLEPTASS